MPLHKSSRAPRLDPTMISAPLGDFRHTMHIGRGGDAFGDTSFLSTHGPSPASSDSGDPGALPAADSEMPPDRGEFATDGVETSRDNDLQHSESVSSFTLDLDLDLGPSILGDVLGVMDGLGLDPAGEGDVFGPSNNNNMAAADAKKGMVTTEDTTRNDFGDGEPVGTDGNQVVDREDGRTTDGNGIKPKGLRPKVRFSDKREEIIRQASEEEEAQGLGLQDEEEPEGVGRGAPRDESGSYLGGGGAEVSNHKADAPPSPASSRSSDSEGANLLDCRRAENCHSETDSEEEMGDCGRGYTFEDEFDDEIGL